MDPAQTSDPDKEVFKVPDEEHCEEIVKKDEERFEMVDPGTFLTEIKNVPTFIDVVRGSGGAFSRCPPFKDFAGNYNAVRTRVALGNPRVAPTDEAAAAVNGMLSGIHPQPYAIGVSGIATSVGVYFEINDVNFFIAHIETSKRTNNTYPDEVWRSVAKKLDQESKNQGWPLQEYDCRKRIQDSLLLVSNKPDRCTRAVVEGIRSFCGCQNRKWVRAPGFIVMLPTEKDNEVEQKGKRRRLLELRYTRDKSEEELYRAGFIPDKNDRTWRSVRVSSTYGNPIDGIQTRQWSIGYWSMFPKQTDLGPNPCTDEFDNLLWQLALEEVKKTRYDSRCLQDCLE